MTLCSIDICAYAVMSNHYRVILHVHTHISAAWSHIGWGE